jgi:hypothetical protein
MSRAPTGTLTKSAGPFVALQGIVNGSGYCSLYNCTDFRSMSCPSIIQTGTGGWVSKTALSRFMPRNEADHRFGASRRFRGPGKSKNAPAGEYMFEQRRGPHDQE